MRRLIAIILMGVFAILPMRSQSKFEIRAAWLTTIGALDFPSHKAGSPQGIRRQKQELCNILDELKQANFNTILLQTRLRGDVIYPSAFEGFAESLTGHTGGNPQYDLLDFAVEECHKRGMELHAWIVAIPVGNLRQVKLQGKNSVVKKHPELCKQYKKAWYLDPGNPATADYLAGIVREIVSCYDIDGIHLDYIRYPEDAQLFPDRPTFRKYGKGKSLEQWRRDNITYIVRRLYTETKRLKPWVKVSSSPIGKYKDTPRYSSRGWNAYQTVYQDAQKWMAEGIHDLIFPMMYFQKNGFYPFALDWNEHKNQRWVVPGLGIYFLHPGEQNWALDEVCRQIAFTRENRLDGQAYFRTRYLLDNTKGLFDELKERIYIYPAVVPPMTWGDSIAPSVPTCYTFNIDSKKATMEWGVSTDNTAGGVYYRIYASDCYPVDTNLPQNLIASRIDSTRYVHAPAFPWQQRMYWAVTAVDRFGNESLPLSFNAPRENSPQIFSNLLPAIPSGATLIVTDATGEELMRLPSSATQLPDTLGKGFFRLTLLMPDGETRFIGICVR